MTEHEEYLTVEDLKQTRTREIDGHIIQETVDLGIEPEDLERINKHSIEDEFGNPKETRQNLSNLLDGEKVLGYVDGHAVYKNEDSFYKAPEVRNIVNYLEETPEKDRRYFNPAVLVRKDQKIFRQGFTTQEMVAKRVVDNDGKWPTVDGMKKYMALTSFSYFYTPKNSSQQIVFNMYPGDTFLTSQSGENKEKKQEMAKANKK